MAVAHKYALLQAFCIPTQDLDDPDAHVHEVAAAPMKREQKRQYDDPDGQMQAWVDQQKAFLTNCANLEDVQGWDELRADAMKRLHSKNLAAWGDLTAFKEARIREISKGVAA